MGSNYNKVFHGEPYTPHAHAKAEFAVKMCRRKAIEMCMGQPRPTDISMVFKVCKPHRIETLLGSIFLCCLLKMQNKTGDPVGVGVLRRRSLRRDRGSQLY